MYTAVVGRSVKGVFFEKELALDFAGSWAKEAKVTIRRTNAADLKRLESKINRP